jgi:hypothetical protein
MPRVRSDLDQPGASLRFTEDEPLASTARGAVNTETLCLTSGLTSERSTPRQTDKGAVNAWRRQPGTPALLSQRMLDADAPDPALAELIPARGLIDRRLYWHVGGPVPALRRASVLGLRIQAAPSSRPLPGVLPADHGDGLGAEGFPLLRMLSRRSGRS